MDFEIYEKTSICIVSKLLTWGYAKIGIVYLERSYVYAHNPSRYKCAEVSQQTCQYIWAILCII